MMMTALVMVCLSVVGRCRSVERRGIAPRSGYRYRLSRFPAHRSVLRCYSQRLFFIGLDPMPMSFPHTRQALSTRNRSGSLSPAVIMRLVTFLPEVQIVKDRLFPASRPPRHLTLIKLPDW